MKKSLKFVFLSALAISTVSVSWADQPDGNGPGNSDVTVVEAKKSNLLQVFLHGDDLAGDLYKLSSQWKIPVSASLAAQQDSNCASQVVDDPIYYENARISKQVQALLQSRNISKVEIVTEDAGAVIYNSAAIQTRVLPSGGPGPGPLTQVDLTGFPTTDTCYYVAPGSSDALENLSYSIENGTLKIVTKRLQYKYGPTEKYQVNKTSLAIGMHFMSCTDELKALQSYSSDIQDMGPAEKNAVGKITSMCSRTSAESLEKDLINFLSSK